MTQTRIAIIGAGVVGATAALVLAQRGHQVDLYSERTAEQLRDDVPATGTAVLFGHSRDVDHTLVPELYPQAPVSTGMNTRLQTGEPGALEQVLAFDPDFAYTAAGIDVRLRAYDRIRLFEQAGGRFIVDTVSPESLDTIAGQHDLTLVSTGKGGLSGLFPVDEARTVYRAPQRQLLAAAFAGLGHGDDVFTARGHGAGAHNVFNLHTDHGEIWIGPYWHKDAGATWSVLGFAKPGGAWVERFNEVTDPQSALEVVVGIYRDYFPDDLPDIEKLRVIEEDRHPWLRGAVTPTVRQGVGFTRSGHPVASLGDTSIAFDPIAGQGAQTGLIQVAALVKAIDDRGPNFTAFTPDWIRDQFDRHWEERGHAAAEVTRLFLGDPDYAFAAGPLFAGATADDAVGAALFNLLSVPDPILDLKTEDDVQRFIDEAKTAALVRS
ncbi:Monooxygenase OS=Tsukamurella paurometabola (strain ATCC 8368 / DSM / CCUG 35730 / CIP 100753/ JCM 10117 / KCTC 9821 / NBRC 16120 / NCIMB 702349 / NCTC 13040) OX=521096 GN=Tpau_2115 PE=4 SV=1 [Tsukamurella paurometabola]|uniref:Monooxygenase n=1 Tax=Tsukamurella paurometabola (strain ATCC 8368 / DSM 20162 / CCUG 35730 / CIP 100753 / JCM 10117 / KCTC 9821 / NBRC 16120 / NCIMB 702349 / NCTC 13040) TaxID=521096 RepID=D5UPH0_TSUPD|nr:styrene monooxygenase/indole monooxygenase family protein [Tsukamurella paurometabola]ADG78726.1 monooxygenase [Tsukamurella paurometabola DSM 20162]SUP32906.1 ubiquinone biosynthesis hydroxylase family protein [Tsukamurella paurometabola]